MTAAIVEGMPKADTPSTPPAVPDKVAPSVSDEERKARNRAYQQKHREKLKSGLTGGQGPSVSPTPPPASRQPLRLVPPAAPKPSPGDVQVPLSDAIRLEVMAPSLCLMAAEQLDDGRLQTLATLRLPLNGQDAEPVPLIAAFGASLDKAADLSGVTLTAMEAALLSSAMLGLTIVGIYRKLPPMPFNKGDAPPAPPKPEG